MSGKPELAENFDLVTFSFSAREGQTVASLALAKPVGVRPPPDDEIAGLTRNLDLILGELKAIAERS